MPNLKNKLNDYKNGLISEDEILRYLQKSSIESLDFVKIDHEDCEHIFANHLTLYNQWPIPPIIQSPHLSWLIIVQWMSPDIVRSTVAAALQLDRQIDGQCG